MLHQHFTLAAIAVILIPNMWTGVASQANGCRSIISSMSSCLSYNSSMVSDSCCTELVSVITLEPQCLCQVQSYGGSNFAMSQEVQALASACGVDVPSFSDCPRGSGIRPPAFGMLSDASGIKLNTYTALGIFFIGIPAAIF